MDVFDSTRVVGVASILVVSAGVGGVVYLLAAYLAKIKEFQLLINLFNSALAKFKS